MDAKAIDARGKALTKAAGEGAPGSSILSLLDGLKGTGTMSEDVLRSTRIGHTVNKFKQHKDPAVARLAGELISKWKKDVQRSGENRHAAVKAAAAAKSNPNGSPSPASIPSQRNATKPGIPPEKRNAKADGVKTDLTGNATRDGCLKLLYDGLAYMSEVAPGDILHKAREIELALFNKFQPETSEPYRTKMRSLFQNLKNKANPQLRSRVLSGEISASRFVTLSHDEMKSAERRAEDERFQKENMDKAMVAQEEKSISQSLECARCKQKKVSYSQAQTRSADEPMTTFCECLNCGRRWKFS